MNFFPVIVQGFFLTRFESSFLTFYGLRNSSSNKCSSDKGGVMLKKNKTYDLYKQVYMCICQKCTSSVHFSNSTKLYFLLFSKSKKAKYLMIYLNTHSEDKHTVFIDLFKVLLFLQKMVTLKGSLKMSSQRIG